MNCGGSVIKVAGYRFYGWGSIPGRGRDFFLFATTVS
jgi:hypothetical protein